MVTTQIACIEEVKRIEEVGEHGWICVLGIPIICVIANICRFVFNEIPVSESIIQ